MYIYTPLTRLAVPKDVIFAGIGLIWRKGIGIRIADRDTEASHDPFRRIAKKQKPRPAPDARDDKDLRLGGA